VRGSGHLHRLSVTNVDAQYLRGAGRASERSTPERQCFRARRDRLFGSRDRGPLSRPCAAGFGLWALDVGYTIEEFHQAVTQNECVQIPLYLPWLDPIPYNGGGALQLTWAPRPAGSATTLSNPDLTPREDITPSPGYALTDGSIAVSRRQTGHLRSHNVDSPQRRSGRSHSVSGRREPRYRIRDFASCRSSAMGPSADDWIRPEGGVRIEACDGPEMAERAPRRDKRRLPLSRNSSTLAAVLARPRSFCFRATAALSRRFWRGREAFASRQLGPRQCDARRGCSSATGRHLTSPDQTAG
jgi:hypothetical protein